jgi:hypothetical protein
MACRGKHFKRKAGQLVWKAARRLRRRGKGSTGHEKTDVTGERSRDNATSA